MHLALYRFSVLLLLLVLSACASIQPAPDTPVAPELIKRLPAQVGSFTYQNYRFFEDAESGYTFRYQNTMKRRVADVYVYPVATENRNLDHDQLVLGSTKATIDAISTAVQDGIYANFNIVGAATKVRGVSTVARIEATYLQQNLASYTLVYQTELDGTFMKIRVSMPDNDANRASTEWDQFAEEMFELISEKQQAWQQEV
ncbi:MAG: hypothetical protein KTR35_07060 [Gammaproteobacteria bacterium]|nr:hypothetical protein [Gammaproteobacteria bacterium]